MALHRVSGNPRLGLALALTTVILWGFLSIALKLLLEALDPYTITWTRMTICAVLLGGFQALRGQLPKFQGLGGKGWGLLAIALVGLVGNYVLFVVSLDFVPPATAQLVIQLAPLLFLLGSLAIFRESFNRVQWAGLALLVGGLALFFNERLPALVRLSGDEAVGAWIVVIAGIVWAGYALAQKQLLTTYSSENILLLIYIGAAVVLLPFARPADLFELSRFDLGLLAFCTFNTLAAYGAFAEALEHWEASRVSAVIALTPLVTIAAVYGLLAIWPHLEIGSRLGFLGMLGAVVVVVGSIMTALGNPRAEAEPVDLE